ncbi:glycosyl transferase group 1 [Grosmannia clavigera kw1407]|uniref:Glycosyl transferase group 1 n=1 Tax=Grosmannia clavigera (strain kw1407 / UAMH 11150) TaxID=655863 RepID=F0XJ00_GROCL|nr:glycosyl transferase group 1 [Grosmannia clavigera kw1407]EFX02313.1 glycosyl transferase group 1 [Grosmannia clavigera kw1407]
MAEPAAGCLPAHDISVFPDRLRGKRVLLCTESFGPVNGVSRTTLMLVDHLRAHGTNVAVVAPHNHTQVDTFVPAVQVLDTAEIRIHGYPLPFNPELSIVYPVRLSVLCARAFGDRPPDLIYLASPASLGFQVLLQLRQQPAASQTPVLANFQTDLAGYCAILFPPPLNTLAVWTFAQVEGFLFRHPSVKTVFYPSRFVRRYLERNGIGPAKMQLLRRGVNTDLFRPSRRSAALRRVLAPHGELVLVCVARLAAEKGFAFLATVAAELHRRGLAFTLLVVGGNRNAAVEADIKDLFADLVRAGRVVFAGFQTGDALAESYASADLFLHCSVTETFGLVVLEAMASGVPVIARDEGGPSDTVVHGVSGFLVSPVDLDDFVDRVLLLASRPDLRAELAANARRQACDATWDKINNTVAWRMSDAIEQHEQHAAAAVISHSTPLLGATVGTRPATSSHYAMRGKHGHFVSPWQLCVHGLNTGLVDARLAAGLGIILGFWGVVGLYLVFIQAALWIKSRIRLAV